MNDPVPMPRLKIPEKNAIATEPAAPACKIISDCAATLNAVAVNPQYAHTHNNEIKEIGNWVDYGMYICCSDY